MEERIEYLTELAIGTYLASTGHVPAPRGKSLIYTQMLRQVGDTKHLI